jgi:2,3-bisphosphoglycerate-independent phosphoglycerate mutase
MVKPVVLCILDGWGMREEQEANAVALADTPVFDHLMTTCPNALLTTHGPDVGLPDEQMGNSEVGHMNIGAGRVVWMDLPRINQSIETDDFKTRPGLVKFMKKMKKTGGTAHLVGLVSPGGVHAHQDHAVAAAKVLTEAAIPVALHALTDGRDVAPKSAMDYIRALEDDLPKSAQVRTVIGRFYAMDRDNRWERVEQAVRAIAEGQGVSANNAAEAISQAYEKDETDEFISPTIVGDYSGFRKGDGVFFLNFRADRARQILLSLLDPEFKEFERRAPLPSSSLGMVEYSDHHNGLMDTLFPAEDITNTLGAWVAAKGKTQFRLAETEKYPHVTFFLNGGVETRYEGEDRHMAPSPKVRTYDLQPEMSADEVGDVLAATIRGHKHDLIVVNFANPDMVGHTGDLDAAIKAVEAVDAQVGRAVEAIVETGGNMIVTADHGNCEMLVDPVTGAPHTAHTTNPVPIILVGAPKHRRVVSGRLADLAPSLLYLMGLEQPEEMTGASLIE